MPDDIRYSSLLKRRVKKLEARNARLATTFYPFHIAKSPSLADHHGICGLVMISKPSRAMYMPPYLRCIFEGICMVDRFSLEISFGTHCSSANPSQFLPVDQIRVGCISGTVSKFRAIPL